MGTELTRLDESPTLEDQAVPNFFSGASHYFTHPPGRVRYSYLVIVKS